MGKNLQNEKEKNFNNMKVGFLLETGFRQERICEELKDLIVFFEDNKEFYNSLDVFNFTSGIDNFIDLFYNFTDIVFTDVDPNEDYCKFHSDFY